MVKIDIFTKPGCGGCEKVKEEIKNTELEDITTYKTIKGKDGIENLRYIKGLGFDNIPVIKVYNETHSRFLVGYHKVDQIQELIDNIDEVM